MVFQIKLFEKINYLKPEADDLFVIIQEQTGGCFHRGHLSATVVPALWDMNHCRVSGVELVSELERIAAIRGPEIHGHYQHVPAL